MLNKATLPNGLRVLHIPADDSQMVYVNLLYGVGARNESYEHTGLAHLLEHLMFEGTKAVPSFDEPLESAGGENNAYTIEKGPLRKLIYQTPWYEKGEIAGLVEFSLEIPAEMPHYVRG